MKRFWFTPPVLPEGPHITVYRCCFTLKEAQTVSFEFSADERAMFFLDGQRIMEGPERGAPQRWYKQNCSFTADAGNHNGSDHEQILVLYWLWGSTSGHTVSFQYARGCGSTKNRASCRIGSIRLNPDAPLKPDFPTGGRSPGYTLIPLTITEFCWAETAAGSRWRSLRMSGNFLLPIFR